MDVHITPTTKAFGLEHGYTGEAKVIRVSTYMGEMDETEMMPVADARWTLKQCHAALKQFKEDNPELVAEWQGKST